MEDKDEIVNTHNELRGKVANGEEPLGVDGSQPQASNMRTMYWNDQLAEIAQRYVVWGFVKEYIIPYNIWYMKSYY